MFRITSKFIYLFALAFTGCMTGFLLSAQPFQLPQPEHITDRQGLPQAFASSVVQDEKGFIWIATLDGFCRYDGDRFKVFQPVPGDSSGLSGPGVINIQTNHHGNLWIETQESLDLFDPQSETYVAVSQQPFYRDHFQQLPTVSYADRRGRIWLANRDGLSVIDSTARHIRSYRHEPDNSHSLSNGQIVAVTEDRNGVIWVAVYGGGLDRLDEKTGRFVHYRARANDTSSLPDDKLEGLYARPDGKLLILSPQNLTFFDPATGLMKSYRVPHTELLSERVRFATDSKGNDYFSQYGNLYHFKEQTGVTCIRQQSSNATRNLAVFVDRSDVLWVGTSGSGLYKFNLKAGSFHSRPYVRNFHVDLLKDHLNLSDTQLPAFSPEASSYYFRYTFDSRNRLWMNVGSTPFYCVDLVSKKVTKVPLPFSFRNIYPAPPAPLATDPTGRVWVMYDSLALWYDEPHRRWEPFPHTIRLPDEIKEPLHGWNPTHRIQFVVDEAALWVITDKKGMYRVDRQTGRTQHYAHHPGDPYSLSSDLLFCLFQDPDDPDILWVGTFGAGLCRFNKKTGKCVRFDTKDGLPNNVIYAAVPDGQGNIWIATNRGLCRMDRKTFEKRSFTREDGLLADEFNRFHFIRLPDDRILLGGLEGITSFYPADILGDTYQPAVEITGIRINNISLETSRSPLIGSRSLQQVEKLQLTHDQNAIAVEFAGLQYNSFKRIEYRYKLEGLDEEWVDVKRGEAVYTNLTPGRYTLKLNTTNTMGAWSPHIRSLSIIVSPPWWATPWAYLVYGIIALYGVYVLKRLYVREKETQQLRFLDELKTRFFSNVTHDFRTPLTLILGPAQQLKTTIGNRNKIQQNRKQVELIEQNARHLLHLVNQLLDLSKLEAKAMQIEVTRGDLVVFTEQIVSGFQAQAQEKGITIEYYPSEISQDYYFDAGKLERILYNLIANALKFTRESGKVKVGLTHTADTVLFTISDTGEGIPSSKLPYIFDRFYQTDTKKNYQQQGTGIGLALVRELIQLQGGRISVTSERGKGTAFSVFMPYIPVERVASSHAGFHMGRLKASPEEASVLIVEDNRELAVFIADCLPSSWEITLAGNGEEGCEKAFATLPDLIICDVMMPVMDGFALCKQLKEDVRTSHIPIILLTAKTSHESRISGLSSGADDYIAKPFQVDELRLKVHNILDHQKKHRDWIHAQFSLPDIELQEEGQVKKINPFLTQVFALLEEHLDDSTFGMEELLVRMGMSRMTFFRKVKTLSGFAPTELIRNYRLSRSADFLKQGATISETAYKSGFSSPAYFSKCFRERYQMTPSEFTRNAG